MLSLLLLYPKIGEIQPISCIFVTGGAIKISTALPHGNGRNFKWGFNFCSSAALYWFRPLGGFRRYHSCWPPPFRRPLILRVCHFLPGFEYIPGLFPRSHCRLLQRNILLPKNAYLLVLLETLDVCQTTSARFCLSGTT